MPKKVYITLPDGYPVCLHKDCPMAQSCLYWLAYQELSAKEEYLRLINPTRCTTSDGCPYYRDNKPVRYARGFTGFQRQMYPQQYDTFKGILIRTFGRSPYFARRAATLPPKEQEIVLQALRQAGVTEQMDFDSYEDRVCWYD